MLLWHFVTKRRGYAATCQRREPAVIVACSVYDTGHAARQSGKHNVEHTRRFQTKPNNGAKQNN
jgi:hypothetical protein